MSEASDFPDPFDPTEPFAPQQPFDPTEHFEPLSEESPEPVFEGLIDEGEASEHTADKLLAEENGEPVEAEADETHFAHHYQHDDRPPYDPPKVRGVLMALGVCGAVIGSGALFASVAEPPPAPTPAAAPTAAAPAAVDPSTDIKALAGRVDDLKGDFDGLGKRIDDLQKAIAAMPKPAPAPDLKPLESEIGSLSKRIDAIPAPGDTKALEAKLADAVKGQDALAAELKALSQSTSSFSKTLDSQKTLIAALDTKVKGLGDAKPAATTATTTTPAATTTATASPTSDADFAKALDLFKKGQYGAAKDGFVALGTSNPSDARAWYYAAIANGYATAKWDGDTMKFVTKGADIEKAGTANPKLDTALADLDANAKKWLDSVRPAAK